MVGGFADVGLRKYTADFRLRTSDAILLELCCAKSSKARYAEQTLSVCPGFLVCSGFWWNGKEIP